MTYSFLFLLMTNFVFIIMMHNPRFYNRVTLAGTVLIQICGEKNSAAFQKSGIC